MIHRVLWGTTSDAMGPSLHVPKGLGPDIARMGPRHAVQHVHYPMLLSQSYSLCYEMELHNTETGIVLLGAGTGSTTRLEFR